MHPTTDTLTLQTCRCSSFETFLVTVSHRLSLRDNPGLVETPFWHTAASYRKRHGRALARYLFSSLAMLLFDCQHCTKHTAAQDVRLDK